MSEQASVRLPTEDSVKTILASSDFYVWYLCELGGNDELRKELLALVSSSNYVIDQTVSK